MSESESERGEREEERRGDRERERGRGRGEGEGREDCGRRGRHTDKQTGAYVQRKRLCLNCMYHA